MNRRDFLTKATPAIIAAPAIVTSKGFWLPSDNYTGYGRSPALELKRLLLEMFANPPVVQLNMDKVHADGFDPVFPLYPNHG